MSYLVLQQPIDPKLMDQLLSLGCYRMRQSMFTTSYSVTDDNDVIQVFWIRINLSKFKPGKRFQYLRRRGKRFQLKLSKATIDKHQEDLYKLYRAQIDFNAPQTIAEFLMGEQTENYFPTYMWQVFDGNRLIAVGYFDLGETSAAGIMNFYHPDYTKFSLSKWLYFESIAFAAENGLHFFYPGYVSIDFAKFDYKLEIGKQFIEVFDVSSAYWLPYETSIPGLVEDMNQSANESLD